MATAANVVDRRFIQAGGLAGPLAALAFFGAAAFFLGAAAFFAAGLPFLACFLAAAAFLARARGDLRAFLAPLLADAFLLVFLGEATTISFTAQTRLFG